MDLEDIQKLFKDCLSDKWYHKKLKKEQLELIRSILEKNKVTFGILPTGFGKSEAYAIPPLLLDEMDPESAPHVALVISPLRSLMLDQVERWRGVGVKCSAIMQMKEMDPEEIEAIQRAEPSIIFSSPEAIMSEPWRSMLHNDHWAQRLCLVCCDEAHCIHDWGLDFRPAYQQVLELRGVADVSWLFLTATCNSEMLQTIRKMIGSPTEMNIISSLPDRPNIFLNFVPKPSSYYKELNRIVNGLRESKENMPKSIIYCSNTEDVCNIWDALYHQLGEDIYLPGKDRQAFGGMLVAQYHRGIGKTMELDIVKEFVKPESSIRVLISTIAFGMGVEIPDIREIIHWGLSSTIPAYWQEVGRSGRDGKETCATLYAVRVDERYSSKEFCDFVKRLRKTDAQCMRMDILKHFVLEQSDTSILRDMSERVQCNSKCGECTCAYCSCCSICRNSCNCRQA